MANPLVTLEAANLFCGKVPESITPSNHLVLAELKLPAWDEQYVDHRPGGAPVAIEIDTMFARPEVTFTLAGWNHQVNSMIDSWIDNENWFFAYCVLRDRQSGEAFEGVATMKGRLGRADPQNWRRGDLQHWAYSIRGIVYYQLKTDNDLLYEWNFFENLFIVGGIDRNERVNEILRTGMVTTTAAPGAVGQEVTSGHDTLKRDGGWSVELVTPLLRRDGTMIDVIDLKPTELDQTIRWGMGQIPSTLALLSEMCGLSESLLRTLKYPDVDRVMLAYSQVIPPIIRKDFEEGSRPFATPEDELPVGDKETVGGINPLFPKVAGDVKPFTNPPTDPPPLGQERRRAPPLPTPVRPMPTTTMHLEEQGGVSLAIPEGAKRVG